MFKTIWFAKRKPGMTRAEYMAFYESSHVPLGEKVMGAEIVGYVRHYLHPMGPDAPEPMYDSVTEIWFRDRAAYDRVTSRLWADKQVAETMVENQQQFIDMASMAHFAIEDRASAL